MNTEHSLLEPTFGLLTDIFQGAALPERLWQTAQPLSTEFFTEPLRLNFETTVDLGITEAHKAALEDFLHNPALYKELVLSAMLERYRAEIIPLFREMQLEELAPEVAGLSQFEALLSLPQLTLRMPVNGVSSLGFSFECTWDVEHGAGALVQGQKLVAVGFANEYYQDVES